MGRAESRPRERQSRRLSFGLRRAAEACSLPFLSRLPRAVARLALALPLLAGAAVFASAASADVLVSNIGQANIHHVFVAGKAGQSFRTASPATLASIELEVMTKASGFDIDDLTVTVANETGGNPGSTLATLVKPGSISADSRQTFTAPEGTVLAADSTYFLVIAYTGGNQDWSLAYAGSNTEDSGGQTGWSIGNNRHHFHLSWASNNEPYQFRVNGTPRAAPTSANKTVTVDQDDKYTFSASDFAFRDTDRGDTLQSVTIVTQPTAGTLRLRRFGRPAQPAPESIPAAALGKLFFTPASGASGTGYASFTFKVSDGLAESASTYRMTIDVIPRLSPSGSWNATMTAGSYFTNSVGYFAGVRPGAGGGTLSEKRFIYGERGFRRTYTFEYLLLDGSRLKLSLGRVPRPAYLDALTLHVGGRSFAFADATWSSRGSVATWTAGTSGLWRDGDTVSLSITQRNPLPELGPRPGFRHKLNLRNYNHVVKEGGLLAVCGRWQGPTPVRGVTYALAYRGVSGAFKPAFGGEGTAAATPGADFTETAEFNMTEYLPGSSSVSDRGCFYIQTIDDNEVEEKPETFEVRLVRAVDLSGDDGDDIWDYGLGDETVVTLMIVDNDQSGQQGADVPKVTLSAASESAAEGDVLEFTLTRTGAVEAELAVNLDVSESGAMLSAFPAQWTIPAGETSVTFTVATQDDETEEADSVITAAIAEDAERYALGEPSTAAVTVADDDGLTAAFEAAPEAHDGTSRFTFELRFSAEPAPGFSYRTLRDHSFAVTGGRVRIARRLEKPGNTRWQITVEPSTDGDVSVTLPADRACDAQGAICTAGGGRLSNAPALTVPGPASVEGPDDPPEPLTAAFGSVPAEHDGETRFTFELRFSEEVDLSYRTLRDHSFAVTGGHVRIARRLAKPSNMRWEITVEPQSFADVRVALAGGRACDAAGAVCTADGRRLSGAVALTVPGPAALSVADARVREGADATLAFAVSLSRAASGPVTVDYATSDGTAEAGSDYTAASGTLDFTAGETSKTVSVAVLDDAHDEGEETLTLVLSNPTGARIADGEATGTIENSDHMPKAWIARFGRTVTGQVLDAVEARLAGPRTPGGRATLAGQALPSWDGGSGNAAANPGSVSGAGDDGADGHAPGRTSLAGTGDREAAQALRGWMAQAGAEGSGGTFAEDGRAALQSRALTGRDFLTGTSFALTAQAGAGGGHASLWGRGAVAGFDGREGDLTLDGEVTTGLLGADWATERWTAGLAVGHSRGTGGYREGGKCAGAQCGGRVEAVLTGLYPYAGLKLTDRVSAWAAAGHGTGELTLIPDGLAAMTADLTMSMGAAGLRSQVLQPEGGEGLSLAVTGRDWRLGWRLTSAVPGDPGFEVNLDATRSEAANDTAPVHGIMLRGAIRW